MWQILNHHFAPFIVVVVWSGYVITCDQTLKKNITKNYSVIIKLKIHTYLLFISPKIKYILHSYESVAHTISWQRFVTLEYQTK
jgi:hypothetical protein